MAKYVDIILTENGVFCAAPCWEVHEGDMVCLENPLTGGKVVHEVISVATDSVDGDHLKMIEKYTGGPLPRIEERYKKYPVTWEEENVHE